MKILAEVGPILRALTRQKSAFLLLVIEAALAFAVISTIIWVGSWYRHRGGVEPGYDARGLISVVSVGGAETLAEADDRRSRERAALEALPGVEAVATLSNDLLEGRWLTAAPVSGDGANGAPEGVWVLDGSDSLLRVLGMPLLAGRGARGDDHELVVSASLASAFYGPNGVDAAIGRPLLLPDDPTPYAIVGVFRDAALVIPYLANATLSVIRVRTAGDERGTRYLVRTEPERREKVLASIATRLQTLDRGRAFEVQPFDLERTRHVKISSGLIQTLGIIAFTLAAVALLGSLAITAFLVQQRTRQVGIRRALGASPWDIVRYFLIENHLAVALGCILGLAISLGYYFALGHLFPGVHLSPGLFVFTALLLFMDGALATLVPALRAARIPPTVASRSL